MEQPQDRLEETETLAFMSLAVLILRTTSVVQIASLLRILEKKFVEKLRRLQHSL